jgi:hypothetical protein
MKKHYIFLISLFIPMLMIGQVDVTLNVNMNYQIELGNFDPANSALDVAGSFEGWTGTPMSDPDGDNIFTVTIPDLNPQDVIEFKFRMNGAWDGTEEFADGGPNRSYTVLESGNDTTYWYNDEMPNSIAEVNADFSFELFPNPAKNIVNVMTESDFNVKRVEVINVCGVTVLSNNFENYSNAKTVEMNVSDLTEGIYFIRISDNTRSATKRLIIE